MKCLNRGLKIIQIGNFMGKMKQMAVQLAEATFWKNEAFRTQQQVNTNALGAKNVGVGAEVPAQLVPRGNLHQPVEHPRHYTNHPSGVECIQITEHMGFNLGNAVKYIWRCDLKQDDIEDLRKAKWYIEREITRRISPKKNTREEDYEHVERYQGKH